MSVLVLLFCAFKLILKLISIADCTPSFELVHRRKYSELAIFTATVAVKIADWLFLRRKIACCRENSPFAIFTASVGVKIAEYSYFYSKNS